MLFAGPDDAKDSSLQSDIHKVIYIYIYIQITIYIYSSCSQTTFALDIGHLFCMARAGLQQFSAAIECMTMIFRALGL